MTDSERHWKASLLALKPLFRRLIPYVRGDGRYAVAACLAIVGIAITNTVMIWLIGKPLNLIQSGEYGAIWSALGLFAVVAVINQAFHFSSTVLVAWLQYRFAGRLRHRMLTQCMYASFPVTDRQPRGDLLTRLNTDVDKVARFMLESPFFVVSHAAIFGFYTTMLFVIDWKLALLALALSLVFLFQQRFFGPRKQRVSHRLFASLGRLLSYESEALANLKGINSYGVESSVGVAHQGLFERARRLIMESRRLDAAFSASFSILIYLCGLVVAAAGVYLIKEGQLAVGALVSFLLYLGYLSVPVRGVAHLAMQYQEDAAAVHRVLQIIDLNPQVKESDGAVPLNVPEGRIQLERVTFGYPGGPDVFRGVTLTIEPGETVALVGPSGTGKSTLAKLLMRFHDPRDGHICIDDTDLRHVTLDSLRGHMAVVWQDGFLLNDSIRANLLMAKPGATTDELQAALQAAQAWDFVAALPDQLDALIGAEGMELSTGQKQRLALAMAFLRDAPLLILDEASSALDSQSEQRVAAALDQLRRDRTTIIIAHRYSSIRRADRIIYLNGDGTVTVGTHEQLLAQHAGYREALHWQAGTQEDE